jgi:hypothetical protein
MKLGCIFANSAALALITLAAGVPSARAEPASPANQELVALDYFKNGRQSGCGIRITGVAPQDLSINLLLSVFSNQAAPPFGLFKAVVRKIVIANGEPLLRDGKPIYSSIGKIHYAWLKTASGAELPPNKNETASHGEGYLTPVKFSDAMGIMGAIGQADFTVGVSTEREAPDTIFVFDQRISPAEAGKLIICMKNLRDALTGKAGAGMD